MELQYDKSKIGYLCPKISPAQRLINRLAGRLLQQKIEATRVGKSEEYIQELSDLIGDCRQSVGGLQDVRDLATSLRNWGNNQHSKLEQYKDLEQKSDWFWYVVNPDGVFSNHPSPYSEKDAINRYINWIGGCKDWDRLKKEGFKAVKAKTMFKPLDK